MHEKQISGFCVVSRENGSIHQIGYCSLQALGEIILYLQESYARPIAKNIEVAEKPVMDLLQRMGFEEKCRQYEMVKNVGE